MQGTTMPLQPIGSLSGLYVDDCNQTAGTCFKRALQLQI